MADRQQDQSQRSDASPTKRELRQLHRPGCRHRGHDRGATNLEIWGNFEGEMEIEGLVWLRPGSRFTGGLVATDLVVEGELRGTVRATSKVDMRASCHVEADVTAPRVAAAEGSHIEGRITVAEQSPDVIG